MTRRTTRDLIRELCAEAGRHGSAALVVAMAHHTAFVHAADPAPLQRLEQLLQSGGRPVGMLLHGSVRGEPCCRARALREWADDPWVVRYLEAVAAVEAALA